MLIRIVLRREMLDCCCTDSELDEARGINENPGRATRALLHGRVVAVLKWREKGSCQCLEENKHVIIFLCMCCAKECELLHM